MLSNFLIRDRFEEFDFNSIQEQENILLNKINYLCLNTNYSNELIEEINDDTNYNMYHQEIKYKIFEDISSVIKKNNMIELVLDIPIGDNIISINKIKLSNKLNKYIKDIFVYDGDEKIITQKDFFMSTNDCKLSSPSQTQLTKIISLEKIINCRDKKNLTLHILLEDNVINKIINKNIFVNYSFTILKNKNKFLFVE